MQKTQALAVILVVGAATAPAGAEMPDASDLLSVLQMRGTIGLSVGVDSNPEEESSGKGSSFTRIEGKTSLQIGDDEGTRAVLDVDGAAITYTDGTVDQDYWYSIDLEIAQPLRDGLEFSLGASRYEDATSDPTTTDQEVWTQASVATSAVDFDLRGSIGEYREEIDRAEIEADDLEVFDYRSYSGRGRAELHTGSPVSPVGEVQVSALDYLERRPGKPERDALQISVMAGARLKVADNATIQLGLRRNERFFDAVGAGSQVTFGPDVEIEWEPNERISLEFSIDRTFDEPTREDGLVRDTIKAGLDWTYRASDKLRLSGGASVKRTKEAGTEYYKSELEAHADARFALRNHVDLLVEGFFDTEARRDDPSRDFGRASVRAGIEASF